MHEDGLSERVIGAAIEVHRTLGPGLLESAYCAALAIEMTERKLPFEKELPVPIFFKGHFLETHYRLDFLVGGRLVVEVKSVESVLRVHRAQLLTYLRIGGYPTGLLLNFHSPVLREGISRMVK